MRPLTRARGFTLIEIMIVVVIIGVITAGLLLSVSLTGRDRELEKESDRLLTLVNYAREQAELQTREFGVIFRADGYQFVAYDVRRGLWREVYEDESLRVRKLPDGLDFKLAVDARPVVLQSSADASKTAARTPDSDKKSKSLQDLKSLKDATSLGSKDPTDASTLEQQKKIAPQVLIFSNGDLSSFEITMERDNGVRSISLALDDKGQVIEKPMVEART